MTIKDNFKIFADAFFDVATSKESIEQLRKIGNQFNNYHVHRINMYATEKARAEAETARADAEILQLEAEIKKVKLEAAKAELEKLKKLI